MSDRNSLPALLIILTTVVPCIIIIIIIIIIPYEHIKRTAGDSVLQKENLSNCNEDTGPF